MTRMVRVTMTRRDRLGPTVARLLPRSAQSRDCASRDLSAYGERRSARGVDLVAPGSQSRTGPRSKSGPLRPIVNSRTPSPCRVGPRPSGPLWTPVERSTSAGSRPSASHQRSRMATLRATTSGSPKPCQMSACRATSRSVLRSPPPPISTGIGRVGGGLSLASRLSIRGSDSARASSREPGGTEVVAVLGVVPLEPAGADAQDQPAAR